MGPRSRQRTMRPKMLQAMIAFVTFLPMGAPAEEGYIYHIALLAGPAPIEVDGDLSDWEGLEAEVEPIGNVCSVGNVSLATGEGERLSPPDSSDLSGSFRCIADPENFYVALEVRDDKLVFGEEKFTQTWNDDSVEIYFDGDLAPKEYAEGRIDYDANDLQIRLSLGRDGRARLEGNALFGEKLFMFPGLWESLGMEGAIKERPWGYTAELKVPKIVFVAVPLMLGVRVGFQVMVNDDDDGGRRDSKISWTEDFRDQSWHTTKYFGRLLIDRKVKPSR